MNQKDRLLYLTGLFDGEGTVDVSIDKRDGSIGKSLQIAMTDLPTLHWVREWFGGNIYPRKTYNIRHKPQHSWKLSGHDAVELARSMVSFSVTKRRQLWTLTQLEDLGVVGRVKKASLRDSLLRRSIVNTIHALNVRGYEDGT